MNTLSQEIKQLVLSAVKRAGSYNPDQIMFYLEKTDISPSMEREIEAFLTWMHENKLIFGSTNIDSRYTAYLKSKEL